MNSHHPQPDASRTAPKQQKRAPRSHSQRRFGAFRKLPAELRLQIWHYLMPEWRDDSESSLSREAFGSPVVIPDQRRGNRLAILRTNHALKNEIEAELYRSRSLTFTIRPEWRGWRVENLPGSTMTDFVHAKFDRFESIQVDIYCPQRDDPGQLLYARASILNLVRLLMGRSDDIGDCEPYGTRDDQKQLEFIENCTCQEEGTSRPCAQIPRIEVRFLDQGLNTWQEKGISHGTFKDTIWLGDDLAILIGTFGFLHMVRGISFTFPTPPKSPRVLITATSVQDLVSGSYTGKSDFHPVAREEAGSFLSLDWALDTAPGPAAAILRRERLIHHRWYRRSVKYFIDLDRRKYRDTYEEEAWNRFVDFLDLDIWFRSHGLKLEVTRDPKLLEEWRDYWPSGIPPKWSPEWNALIAARSRP